MLHQVGFWIESVAYTCYFFDCLLTLQLFRLKLNALKLSCIHRDALLLNKPPCQARDAAVFHSWIRERVAICYGACANWKP